MSTTVDAGRRSGRRGQHQSRMSSNPTGHRVFEVHRGRPRSWYQHPTLRVTSPGVAMCCRRPPSSRSPNSTRMACSCLTAPATRPLPITSSLTREVLGAEPVVRHLFRQPDPVSAGPSDLQDGVWAPRHQHPGRRPRHRSGGGDRANHGFALREAGQSFAKFARSWRWSATCARRCGRSRAGLAGRAALVQYHRKPPPARTMPEHRSTSSWS